MSGDTTDYRSAAESKFAALAAVFAKETVYWRLGHTFDTALDYFDVVCHQAAEAFGGKALERFEHVTDPAQWATYWYDDHGWWGVASHRAAGRPQWFGTLTKSFNQISERCWATMDELAPTVWQRRPRPGGEDRFAALQPRIEGGVWNSDWSVTGSKPCDPTDRSGQKLCGYQNTVTNLLYLILAQRRYETFHLPPDAAAAERDYGFLTEWFNLASSKDALLNRYRASRFVVRAEVSTYASFKHVTEYEPNFAWAGDQGLLLAVLIDRMQLLDRAGREYAALLRAAEELLAGACERLTSKGVLEPWYPPPPGGAPGGDDDDYRTGVAVFFRCLVYSYLANGDLRALLGDERSIYPAFVRANADYAAAQESKGEMTALTNDLARLVAAVAILPKP